MGNSKDQSGKSSNELKVQVCMQEYDKLRQEVMHYTNIKSQTLLWTLGVASVAVPLFLSQASNFPSIVIAGLLYGVSIIFASMTFTYVTANYGLNQISIYIRDIIEPQIKQVINDDDFYAFQWEASGQRRRASFFSLFLESISDIGTLFLLLLPGLVSLILAGDISSWPQNSTNSQFGIQIGSNWLSYLSIAACFFYVLSVVSLITLTVYVLRLGVIKRKNKKQQKK